MPVHLQHSRPPSPIEQESAAKKPRTDTAPASHGPAAASSPGIALDTHGAAQSGLGLDWSGVFDAAFARIDAATAAQSAATRASAHGARALNRSPAPAATVALDAQTAAAFDGLPLLDDLFLLTVQELAEHGFIDDEPSAQASVEPSPAKSPRALRASDASAPPSPGLPSGGSRSPSPWPAQLSPERELELMASPEFNFDPPYVGTPSPGPAPEFDALARSPGPAPEFGALPSSPVFAPKFDAAPGSTQFYRSDSPSFGFAARLLDVASPSPEITWREDPRRFDGDPGAAFTARPAEAGTSSRTSWGFDWPFQIGWPPAEPSLLPGFVHPNQVPSPGPASSTTDRPAHEPAFGSLRFGQSPARDLTRTKAIFSALRGSEAPATERPPEMIPLDELQPPSPVLTDFQRALAQLRPIHCDLRELTAKAELTPTKLAHLATLLPARGSSEIRASTLTGPVEPNDRFADVVERNLSRLPPELICLGFALSRGEMYEPQALSEVLKTHGHAPKRGSPGQTPKAELPTLAIFLRALRCAAAPKAHELLTDPVVIRLLIAHNFDRLISVHALKAAEQVGS